MEAREAEHEGIIVVKKNSGIKTLADLRGKVVAFDEPHSTSASILPRMLLEEKKLKTVEIKSPGTVKPDVVGYMYGTDGNATNVLITGRAEAAATIHREIERLKPEVRESLQIIGHTTSVPRQLMAVRKDLDPKMINAVKEILISMEKDPTGQGVLARQQNTTKFDEIPPGSLAQFKSIEKFVISSLGKEVDSW
jgi:phosphonate transport system substrate-binding protein